jgi:hypothetical protein
VICPVCGDQHTPNPRFKERKDCPECWVWASRAVFGLPTLREPWKQAKRFLHKTAEAREALRQPAFGVRSASPSETVVVPALRSLETVQVQALKPNLQAS